MVNFEYVLAKENRKCTVCGKDTKFIEINYEEPLCSDECCKKLDAEYMYLLQKCYENDCIF